MNKTIYLIRHGQTQWVHEKRYCGQTDIPLNATGYKQAQALQPFLQDIPFSKVYSSDLCRAAEYAHLAVPSCFAEKRSELRELSFGVFEGKTYDELCASSYQNLYEQWLENPGNILIPEGESATDFSHRINCVWQEILAQPDAMIALFSHGGPIRYLLSQTQGNGVDGLAHIALAEGAVSIIKVSENRLEIVSQNDTRYYQQL